MENLIAVLAGTPVDTQMGVDVLESAGLQALAFPLADNPWEQTAFQISSAEEKRSKVLSVLRDAQAQGCRKVLLHFGGKNVFVFKLPILPLDIKNHPDGWFLFYKHIQFFSQSVNLVRGWRFIIFKQKFTIKCIILAFANFLKRQ